MGFRRRAASRGMRRRIALRWGGIRPRVVSRSLGRLLRYQIRRFQARSQSVGAPAYLPGEEWKREDRFTGKSNKINGLTAPVQRGRYIKASGSFPRMRALLLAFLNPSRSGGGALPERQSWGYGVFRWALRDLLAGANMEACDKLPRYGRRLQSAPQRNARRPRRAAPHREVILPLQARRVASRPRGGARPSRRPPRVVWRETMPFWCYTG